MEFFFKGVLNFKILIFVVLLKVCMIFICIDNNLIYC